MNTHTAFDDHPVHDESGFINPEKLLILKRVSDTICQEAAIPMAATNERNDLAQELITVSASMDKEASLLEFARSSVAHFRC